MNVVSSSQVFQALLSLKESRDFKSAAKHHEWLSAMDDEIQALKNNHTWILVHRLQNHNVVGFSKPNSTQMGLLSATRPVWSLRGFLRFTILILEILLALLCHLPLFDLFYRWPLRLDGVYTRSVYGTTSGIHRSTIPSACLSPEASSLWFETSSSSLVSSVQLLYDYPWFYVESDSSLFGYHSSLGMIYLLHYVDDMVITGNNPSLVQNLISRLFKEFSMKDLGDLHYFLGVEVQSYDKGLFLSQTKYVLDLLQRASMIDAKPISTPFVVGAHLSAEGQLFPDPTFCFALLPVFFNT
ncbi:PREDICTED: uncharacterized protein LOC105954057 [Erythranthe guttata]|uniref:uncharacterized protein LOC105954057 n=1 Tax=Erythranthe guttata TaxID=4155 RepID=UPI00064DC332|nr:PREDICTED: uncharacterized protein LOC105954057 [Erythranthe guttata]|eukprot:XP_012833182.1 PREDICTED: uncharacterized protein LOC105954057 [Erythranthe guttata]